MKSRPDRRAIIAESAKVREAQWRELPPEAQLAALDVRLGKNQGAKKQRARLKAALRGA